MDSRYSRMQRKRSRHKNKRPAPVRPAAKAPESGAQGARQGFSWMSVALSLLAVVIVASGLVLMSAWTKSSQGEHRVTPPPEATPPSTAEQTDQPTDDPNIPSEMIDLTQGSFALSFNFNSINQPVLYENTLLFSAGSGSPDQPVLKALYAYRLDTQELTKLADTKVRYGEIYEPQISPNWIIWLDTDQGGTHQGYFMDRSGAREPFTAAYKFVKPKFRLNGDLLAWMAQTDEKIDSLFVMDLTTGEDLMLYQFSETPEYGMSAPWVDGAKIVWAGPDRLQSDTQRRESPHSVIMTFDFNHPYAEGDHEDGEVSFLVEEYRPGMYVHEPIMRGNKIAWIDMNKAPNSNLYTCIDHGPPMLIAESVTSYALGNEFLVYASRESIWVYFYESGRHACLTAMGEKGILPIVHDRTVIWYDRSGDTSKDSLRVRTILPEEYPDGTGPSTTPNVTLAPPATADPNVPEGIDEGVENGQPQGTGEQPPASAQP